MPGLTPYNPLGCRSYSKADAPAGVPSRMNIQEVYRGTDNGRTVCVYLGWLPRFDTGGKALNIQVSVRETLGCCNQWFLRADYPG